MRGSCRSPTGARKVIGFARAVERGDVPIRTLDDVLSTYARRPEHKSLRPDGSPTGPTNRGLLRRRPIRSSPVVTVMSGTEVNKLLERATGEVIDPAAYWTDYGFRLDPWDSLVVPALRRIGVAEIVRRTDTSWRRAIQEYLRSDHPSRPHDDRVVVPTRAAAEAAAEALAADGRAVALDPLACLDEFLSACAAVPACACGCGRPARRRWATDACRKRASGIARAEPVGCAMR